MASFAPKSGKFHPRMAEKCPPQTASEEEKIALLQAAHDALYLLSGIVTHPAEQYYLAHALPVVTSYLDRHESDPVADGCPLLLAFLRLSLVLLYSSRFLSAAWRHRSCSPPGGLYLPHPRHPPRRHCTHPRTPVPFRQRGISLRGSLRGRGPVYKLFCNIIRRKINNL